MVKHIRQKMLFLLLLFGSYRLNAEQVHYYISITNPSYVPRFNAVTGVYTFQQFDLNITASQYVITGFAAAFPTSRFEFLKQVYSVYVNDPAFFTALHSAYPSIFVNPMAAPGQGKLCYTPNDYGLYFGGAQEDLDQIQAKLAWDVTKGDPTIKIGVTDGYVKTSHPDLAGKIGTIYSNSNANVLAGLAPGHGSSVAGLIAGKTDNNTGLASIGFNSKVNISSDRTDSAMLALSAAGMQIINGSWIWPGSGNCADSATFALSDYALGQAIYNEVYENGTFAVFAAGNGDMTGADPAAGNACGGSGFYFPAALDHNFSVTAVGQIIPVANVNSSSASVKDVHYLNPQGGIKLSTVHNNRVDLSAPGYYNRVYDFDTNSPSVQYNQSSGTSLSAPLVAGTAALMLAVNKVGKPSPCLSPYQLEYLLKKTADPIDQISYNVPFAGRLGAGRLNANNAVNAFGTSTNFPVSKFNCNDPATQTMYISSVDITSLCNPGQWQVSNGPQLSVTIANGTPPYKYNWIPLSNNAMHIDYTSAASPRVDQDWSWGQPNSGLFYYTLQVTDNSTIPKVASKVVKFQMKTSGYDLAMKDSPYDMYQEPNNQEAVDPRDWEIWHSPDLWIHNSSNGPITTNENAEFFTSGAPNKVYVHIRNVGCAASPATGINAHVYWTKASTGEAWKGSWDTATAMGVTPPNRMTAGGEITNSVTGIALKSIQPGKDTTIVIPWNVVNPALYFGQPSAVDACLLARIQESNTAPYGMAFAEVSNTTTNVKKNNNIVTRNTSLVNLGRSHAKIYHEIIFSNAEIGDVGNQIFSLQMLTGKDIQKHFAGNLSDYMYATLTLDPVLFDRWVTAGAAGNYGVINPETKSVTYDPSTPLRLDGISLAPGERFTVGITFQLRDNTVPFNIDDQHIYVRQLTTDSLGDHVYGNVSFDMHIDTDNPPNGLKPTLWRTTSVAPAQNFTVYPNPANEMVNLYYSGAENVTTDIEVTDITGRHIYGAKALYFENGQTYGINIASYTPGIYIVHVKNGKGLNESYRVTKL